jgi:alcohol dehydrogenase (NADP+)
MLKTRGYGTHSAFIPLTPFSFERREPRANDVHIQIQFCGVCHSDIHQVRNEWGSSRYPIVPGHEIIGTVAGVGSNVSQFKVGDRVGVGCLVDACGTCPDCQDHLEQFCPSPTFTYNSADAISGGNTYGGYSNQIVVDQRFVLRVSEQLDPAAAAPLLCAGITTYSPLRHWQIGAGHKVGIVGLGGLGHMGVKFAHAMGAEVVLFTTSPHKVADALRLGAQTVVLLNDSATMQQHSNSFDFILDTVSASHNLDAFTCLLKRDGSLCLVGVPEHPHPAINVGNLIFRRRHITGSLIGGIKQTQEMLDFCAEHQIVSDIEVIAIQDINKAYERMLKNDVKYRFVIDLASFV